MKRGYKSGSVETLGKRVLNLGGRTRDQEGVRASWAMGGNCKQHMLLACLSS